MNPLKLSPIIKTALRVLIVTLIIGIASGTLYLFFNPQILFSVLSWIQSKGFLGNAVLGKIYLIVK
jgi:hypothetical protein